MAISQTLAIPSEPITRAAAQSLYPAAAYKNRVIWISDDPIWGQAIYGSNGSVWRPSYGARRQAFQRTTDGSGNVTLTTADFTEAWPNPPHVDVQFYTGNARDRPLVTARSTTSVTIQLVRQNSLTVLGLDVLGLGTTPVTGSVITVELTEL